MYQVIKGVPVYVVEFDTMPEMPITRLTAGEFAYKVLTAGNIIMQPRISYAIALTNAIETGVITEPGKYGIHLVPGTYNYEIYKVEE